VHLLFNVIAVPRYLKLLTCFKIVPTTIILHLSSLFFFDVIIASVFIELTNILRVRDETTNTTELMLCKGGRVREVGRTPGSPEVH
jgi:hypothetical protein